MQQIVEKSLYNEQIDVQGRFGAAFGCLHKALRNVPLLQCKAVEIATEIGKLLRTQISR